MSDRRIWFFLVAAVAAAALTPLAPADFQWVPKVTSGAYVLLTALVGLDMLSRRAGRSKRE